MEFLLSLLSSGWTVDQILYEMPQLETKDIYAVISCAADVLRLLVERDLHTKFLPQVNDSLER